jgi:cytidine deaminase
MLSDDLRRRLIKEALEVREQAYAPYSGYPVGAALLCASGEIYTGVNVENASYPHTICAERTAVFKAVSEGKRDFKAIAIVSKNGGSPCGACRQVLSEFGLDTVVLIADQRGELIAETRVTDLLPGAFGPDDLT